MDTEIPANGVTAFFGRSGSGKTSLLRCIAGLEKPEIALLCINGTLWHDSNNNIFVSPDQRGIGYVFQEGVLFPKMTVKKNLLFGYHRTPKNLLKIDFKRVVDLLELEILLNRFPFSLSGGEKQRVAIGRALLNNPRLLLMDEPMASLDNAHKKDIFPYLENLHQNFQIPIIYITHDREEMLQFANYLVLVDQGKIIAQGPIEQVLTRLDLPIAREDGAAAVVEAEVIEHDYHFYLTKLAFAGGVLQTSWINREKGCRLRIRILAKDVSISLRPQEKTSIINMLPAVIEEMQAHGKGRMLVRLKIGEISILSRITQKSCEILGIKAGDHVFAEVRSVAL